MMVETHFIMIASTLPFPRHRHFNFLLQYRLELANEANVCYAFLHDDGNSLGTTFPTLVHSILELFHGNTVPPDALAICADLLFQCEIAVQFQVEGVELSDLGVRCFVDDLSGHMELGALRVEVEVFDADLEGEVDTGGRS